MKIAYVDSSCLAAIAFEEKGSAAVARRLAAYDQLFSSNLMEAELRSAHRREGQSIDRELFHGIDWVHVNRPLSEELAAVLSEGYLRGADAWHVATALFASSDPTAVYFETLDQPQRRIAAVLGFKT